MARILVEEPLPNGTTQITLDLDGVRVAQIVVPTVTRHDLAQADIDAMLDQATKRERRRAKT